MIVTIQWEHSASQTDHNNEQINYINNSKVLETYRGIFTNCYLIRQWSLWEILGCRNKGTYSKQNTGHYLSFKYILFMDSIDVVLVPL